VLNVIPARTQRTAGVRSGPKSSSVMNAEHGKAASLDYARRGQPNRKAGPAGVALGWPKKPRPVCNEPDMPTSAWPGKARKVCGTTSTWESNRRATPVARCTQSCCPQEHSDEGRNPVLPNGSRRLRCHFVRHRFPSSRGSARKGLALERFEPCEAKVSRTVLRGAWAG
jgi:hypothetical protein